MGCVEKACIWPAEANGYCVHHARMFSDIAGRYAEIRREVHNHGNTQERMALNWDAQLEADHVLIHGAIFNRKDKEPFAKSKCSLLGALEYDQATDRVKCHECGGFFGHLSNHIPKVHGMSGKEYRRSHGLFSRTKLTGLFHEIPRRSIANLRRCSREVASTIAVQARETRVRNNSFGLSPETLNLRNRCNLQILDRLRTLGRRIGRTPTCPEMEADGLRHQLLEDGFGSVAEAIRLAGMAPRKQGARGKGWKNRTPGFAQEQMGLQVTAY